MQERLFSDSRLVSERMPEGEANPQGLSSHVLGVLYLVFFLSGTCALIYEIAWTRRLTLIFGNTVYSISTVLVAFMGGLAGGSLLFGRLIDRRKDPIRIYALLEVGVGVSAILLPFILAALTPAYRFLYNLGFISPYALNLVKFLLSAAVLIIPTTLMGATLPVLSKFVVRKRHETGANIGALYAINTFGAVAGCFLAGFILLGWLGVTNSEYLAVSINFLVAAVAFALHRSNGYVPDIPDTIGESDASEHEKPYSSGTLKWVLLVLGISGMSALAYEVLWSRILIFLLGSSIYSFSFILMVYLFGITAGSFLFARVADNLKRPLHVFGWIEILIGITVLAGLILFRWLPFTPYSLLIDPWSYLAKNLFSSFLVVLPPTLLMGAAFPVAVRVYARNLGAIGRQTGILYAVNTVGAIIGSFVSGFVLIPAFGSKNSMLLLIVTSIFCGLILFALAQREKEIDTMNWLVAGLIVLPLAGFAMENDLIRELSVKPVEERTNMEWKVLAFAEDATAAVAVAENNDGTRILTVNGIPMTYLDVEPQLMAHLPLALANEPANALVVCFGMGTTFVSARSAGMDVDFVELCPFVVDSFEYYHDNPSALEEPGVGKIIADGRNHLLLTRRKYDVITIDPPPPPYSAGTVNLYTKEFYELCKQRLTPDGIVCQWIPMYSSSEQQYRMLLRTFMEVFPHTSVWSSLNRTGTFFIGAPEPLRIDKQSFNAYFANPSVKDDLSLYADEPIDGQRVLSLLLLDENAARYYVEDTPVMTDDLPLIEFPLFRTDPTAELMHVGLLTWGQ